MSANVTLWAVAVVTKLHDDHINIIEHEHYIQYVVLSYYTVSGESVVIASFYLSP